jgi:hypothetical protein
MGKSILLHSYAWMNIWAERKCKDHALLRSFWHKIFFSTEDFQDFEELAKNFIMKTFILNEGEM